MKRIFLLVILLLTRFISAEATHIVGGELEMLHLGGNSYRLSLIMYFDGVNGDPGAINNDVRISIFSKQTNMRMQNIILPIVSDVLVPYTQPACAVGSLVTRRIYYSRVVDLDPNAYSQAAGYYMVWERCCRNGVINNIVAPGAAGQVFYLEFPALIRGGARFFNSSPRLFPPVSDYACVNQPFTFNFGGTDPDGDQLVYRLTTPLNGFSSTSDPAPLPSPGPYPLVNFVPGIGVTNMIPGTPPLSISPSGVLSLRASAPGLYVFAVAVDEFRNGVKIGEVRREFQLMVLDCPAADPPEVKFKADVSSTFYTEGTVITLNPSDSRCGKIFVTDPNIGNVISAIAQPLNFSGGVTISPSTQTITNPGTPVEMTVCFPDCPLPGGEPYRVRIITRDNSCAVPLADTVTIQVRILSAPNDKPVITTNITPPPNGKDCYKKDVTVGETVSFDVIGNDVNNDTISLSAVGDGFDMTALGMIFAPISGRPILRQKFTWTPKCDDLPDGVKEKQFKVFFYVKDQRKCDDAKSDTTCVIFTLRARPNENRSPVLISLLRRGADSVYYDTLHAGQIVDFDLLVTDIDKDTVNLGYAGVNFTPPASRITLNPTTGRANYRSKFTWRTTCADLPDINKPHNFILRFRATDVDVCKRAGLLDTITVRITLLPPKNEKPVISTTLPYDNVRRIYYDTVEVGETVLFDVKGFDPDNDSILVSGNGIGYTFPDYHMLFSTTSGRGTVIAPFKWLTKCEHLTDITRSRDFYMQFKVTDIKDCENNKIDTCTVRITLVPPRKRNSPPLLSIPGMYYNAALKQYEDTVFVGDLVRFNVVGEDPELDLLEIKGQGIGFTFPEYDMIFRDTTGNAPLRAPFTWQTLCKHLGANIRPGAQKDFYIRFTAREFKSCQKEFMDSIRVKLTLKYTPLPPNAPELSTSLEFDAAENVYFIRAQANDLIKFDVIGRDKDNSTIRITGKGDGFDMNAAGIVFNQPLVGKPVLRGQVSWKTDCSMLADNFGEKAYYLTFLAEDLNNCDVLLTDTIRVKIILSADPKNTPPVLTAEGITFEPSENAYKVEMNVNQTLKFDLVADDAEKNTLTLSGTGIGFDMSGAGMLFETKTGTPILRSPFEWTPTCGLLGGEKERLFELKFIASDVTPCGQRGSTPVLVKIMVRDFEQVLNYLPPNVFTPNNDGKNDAFTMPDLPVNTCTDEFESIKIYNRWDKLVFESTDRNFAWQAADFPPGVYYYLLKFTRREYKGSVTLIGR
jgi:gliding motility-associated-like protein